MNPQQKARDLYTKKADLYQKLFIGKFNYQKGIEAFLKGYFSAEQKPAHILDAGTGTGALIKSIYNILPKKEFEKINFTAFDITPKMLKIFDKWIKENSIQNIKTLPADVLDLNSIKNSNYDLIISSGMLEYLYKKDFPTALKSLFQKLKPNGKLLLFISKKTFINFFLIKLWWKANLYSKNELLTAFKKSGFSDINFYNFPNYLNSWGFIIEAKKP